MTITDSMASHVLTGLDVLLRDGHPILKDASIGLLTNHSAVTGNFAHILDAMHGDWRFRVTKLFAPEHGIRGAAQAGDHIADDIDIATGLPVISLYGNHLGPTSDDLADLDVVIFDIQDVGARHYTYISTMVYMMAACARSNVRMMVLDRPNPITGVRSEGKVLDAACESFVGIHPIPTRHGLTLGELALLIANDRGLPQPIIVPCEGWLRTMWWDETGLPVIAPSPNLPTLTSITAYTATCILEATTISEGRGTTQPFEVFGAPWIDAHLLACKLNELSLPGVHFRPTWFTPWFSKHLGERCGGIQMHIIDRARFSPVATGVHILHTLIHLPGSEFGWQTGEALGMSHARLYGGTDLHDMLQQHATAQQIIASWQPELDAFVTHARQFSLYDS